QKLWSTEAFVEFDNSLLPSWWRGKLKSLSLVDLSKRMVMYDSSLLGREQQIAFGSTLYFVGAPLSTHNPGGSMRVRAEQQMPQYVCHLMTQHLFQGNSLHLSSLLHAIIEDIGKTHRFIRPAGQSFS